MVTCYLYLSQREIRLGRTTIQIVVEHCRNKMKKKIDNQTVGQVLKSNKQS